jgi:hypothetical protein
MSDTDLKAFVDELMKSADRPLIRLDGMEDLASELTPALAPGEAVEVSEEIYDWFLEVLPARWLLGRCFCYAEGLEPFRFIWCRGRRYFMRQLSWEETSTLCKLARIPLYS